MIDHAEVTVSKGSVSRAFYAKALAPLGYSVLQEIPTNHGGRIVFGMGVAPHADFWVAEGATPQR